MLGIIHFSDGHTEEITSYLKDRQRGLIKVHTKTGLYIDKTYYSYQSPFMSFMDAAMSINYAFPAIIHVYFERVMDISENDVVDDRYVRAAIDKIEYVHKRRQSQIQSSIPNLLAILRSLNINLDILAMYTGIKKATLVSYVEGSVKPRKETVDKIAKALNVSTDDLVRRDYIGTEMAMLNAVDNAAKKKKANAEILAEHFEKFINEKFFGYADDEDDDQTEVTFNADYVRNGGRFG